MKQLLITVMLVCITQILFSQNSLVFTKTDSSKTVVIKENMYVAFNYNGYLQQKNKAIGYVQQISDSMVTLTLAKKFLSRTTDTVRLFVKDITGFRVLSKTRPVQNIIPFHRINLLLFRLAYILE